MLRRVIATALAALSLAAGFHASIAAAPPVLIECRTPAQAVPVMILIANQGDGKVRDAVHHCRFFWGGHPAGAVR